MIKVVKAETIGYKQWWDQWFWTEDVTWEQSLIYQHLNDLDEDETNNVLSNPSIIPSDWVNRIASVKWNVGNVNGHTDEYVANASTIISYEDNAQTSSMSKIGLIYLSDYYYAADRAGTTKCFNNSSCLNWLTFESYYESIGYESTWTMTNYGYITGDYYYAWYVNGGGSVKINQYAEGYVNVKGMELHPVFYLNSDVQFTGQGDGSKLSPLQIV